MSKRKVKLKLYNLDRYCYWCGRETFLHKQIEKKLSPDCATIDHLYTLYDAEMRQNNPTSYVLACYECNHRRGNLASYIYNKYHALCEICNVLYATRDDDDGNKYYCLQCLNN